MPSKRRIKSWYRKGVRWVAKRWRMLLLALVLSPAVLVTISIVLLAMLATGPDDAAVAWYRREGAHRMSTGDFATARLCYASLVQKSPEKLEYKYGLATSLSKLGEYTAAAMLMRQLAPEDAAGYLPAQLEVARQLLSAPSPTPEAIRSTEARLQQVLKVQPKNAEAHSMLAVLYSKSNQWDLVKQHMAFSGAAVDELTLPAALAFAQRGDQTESEVWARHAVAYYAPRVKADPKNDDQRLKYAQACLLLRDFAKTLEILDAGWQQNRNPVFRKAVGRVSSLWLSDSPTMDAPRKLALVENGLLWDSQNSALLGLLLDPETASVAAALQPTTAPVQGAAVRALLQAVDACRQKHAEDLRSNLALALNLGGAPMTSIASNLTCVWVDSKPQDLAVALRFNTSLLELQPGAPVVQRAQGIVLVRQEQWGKAVEYLTAALPAMPDDGGIHGALAIAYEKLGKPDLAAKHLALSQPTTVPTTTPSPVPATVPAVSTRSDHK